MSLAGPFCLPREDHPVCRIHSAVGISARCSKVLNFLLLAVFTLVGSKPALSHQDPLGCHSPMVQLTLEAFLADQVTPLAPSVSVTECQTICLRSRLIKKGSDRCAYEGGTLTIELSDGSIVPATPPGGIPCLGGQLPPECNPGLLQIKSDLVCFQVRPQDVTGGRILTRAIYADGDVHTHDGDLLGVNSATTALSLAVLTCPPGQQCNPQTGNCEP